MANTVTGNIIHIDTAAVAFEPKATICTITIAPTNATWAVELTDGAGNTFLKLNTNSPAPIFPTPIRVTGITVATLTAATVEIVLN